MKWLISRRDFLKLVGLSGLSAYLTKWQTVIAAHLPLGLHQAVDPVVTDWPPIICGPMLRRVEERSVSVFVALATSRKVTLSLYEGNTTSARLIGQNNVDTVGFGKYLHAVVITVTLPEAEKLRGGVNYGYNLTFQQGLTPSPDEPSSWAALTDLSPLLQEPLPLGYEVNKLPTFAYCPADLSQLKIVHASCRKPHGESDDLLPVLDDYIKARFADPLARPHQLFLTGDQIYADDVNDLLLTMLTQAGDAVLGWNPVEQLAIAAGNKPARELLPSLRAEYIEKEARFKTEEGISHLMSMGEFFAMYLFVWSDVVWPATLPEFATVYPESERDKVKLGKKYEEQRVHFDEKVRPAIEGFLKGIARVRRALANVPTYMMFDDHEITDDWYLHSEIYKTSRATNLGQQIYINALSAYTVFQAWGNNPDYFQSGQPGGSLLALISHRDGKPETMFGGKNIYEELKRLLVRVPDEGDRIEWNYIVDAPAHRAIILDTRTRRNYVNEEKEPTAPANLLSLDEIQRQIPPIRPSNALVTFLISPAPVFGLPFMEKVVQRIGGALGISHVVDREAWFVDGRPLVFEALLEQLSGFERVVILSGDVHYGFSLEVKYWNRRAASEQRATFVQLVSSSLRNQDFKTLGLTNKWTGRGVSFIGRGFPVESTILRKIFGRGVVNPNSSEPLATSRAVLGTKQSSARITVETVKLEDINSKPWHWSYLVDFCIDTRSALLRDTAPRADAVDAKIQSSQLHRNISIENQMRAIVGFNNFGVVTLNHNKASENENDIENVNVFHKLYFAPKAGQPPQPYTRHAANLSIPTVHKSKALPDLTSWTSLLSHVPERMAQERFRTLFPNIVNWYFHRIERAGGKLVNLDYYPITVTKLPTSLPNGEVNPDAKAVFHYWRTNFTKYLDSNIATFGPYQVGLIDEKAHWESANPLGAVCSFKIRLLAGLTDEKASVVVTRWDEQGWIFSTARTANDADHPVSGNRMFGYMLNPNNEYTFFTMGADRVSVFPYTARENDVFAGGHDLWLSLQRLFVDLIKQGQGEAKAETPVSQRYVWEQVVTRYFNADPSDWL